MGGVNRRYPGCAGQVSVGGVTQAGEPSNNVTRKDWLGAGLPGRTACTSSDCACGSSQQAVHMVAGLIASGQIDAGIGCGVEAMSRVSLGAALAPGTGMPMPDDFTLDMPDQFTAAERIAAKYGITREAADHLALAREPGRERVGQDVSIPVVPG